MKQIGVRDILLVIDVIDRVCSMVGFSTPDLSPGTVGLVIDEILVMYGLGVKPGVAFPWDRKY